MTAIEIVPYDREWEAAHTEFARRTFPGKARRADPTYQRWEYRAADSGPVDGLLLAVMEGRVVGQLGLLPGKAMVGGVPGPIQWTGNLMVERELRREGIASMLYDVGIARTAPTFGTDPSPAAAKTLASLGFDQHEASHAMVLTLQAGPVLATRYPQLARVAPLVTLAGRPATRLLSRRLVAGRRSDRAQVCSWRDVVDDVAAAEAAMVEDHAIHDEEFLAWRCTGLDGWVREVEAVRTVAGSFALLDRAGPRMLVHQWHAVDEDEAAAVFGRALFIAEGYGFAYIQVHAGDDAERSMLTRLGFRARRHCVDLWAYPAGSVGTGRFRVELYDTDSNL